MNEFYFLLQFRVRVWVFSLWLLGLLAIICHWIYIICVSIQAMLFMSGRPVYRRFLASTTKLTLYQPMITGVNTAMERRGRKRWEKAGKSVGKSAGVTKTLKIKLKGEKEWGVTQPVDGAVSMFSWQCATCLLLVKCMQCSQDCDSEYLQCLPTSVHLIAQSTMCLMRACDLPMTSSTRSTPSHRSCPTSL